MSPIGARRLAWFLWAIALAGVATTATIGFARGSLREDPLASIPLLLAGVGYPTVGALVASRHPSNAIGWILLSIAVLAFTGISADEYVYGASAAGRATPPGLTAAVLFSTWSFPPGVVQIPLLLLLFPAGSLPSRRWRIVVGLLLGGAGIALLGSILDPRPFQPHPRISVTNPLGVEALRPIIDEVMTVGAVAATVGSVLSVAGLVVRFRRSSGDERQQIRWLAYVGMAAALFFIGLVLSTTGVREGDSRPVEDVFFSLFFLTLAVGVPVAAGVAILKYRLYDLDIVVKKTVVLGALLALFSAVYLLVVVGIGALVGGANEPVLTFAGAALAALAFQPVRTRARRLADRIVYGKRSTPYEVLSEFADRVSGTYSTEDVLPRMARLLAEGTGARQARVWLRIGEELRPVASHPPSEEAPDLVQLTGDDLPGIPDADLAFPVQHRGALLGAITVAMPPSEPPTPSQERLVRDVASQAGLVLSNVRLTEELRANLEELRASRQRIVAAQDSRAKALERNLHDGAQQQLVALTVKLRLAETLAERDPERVAPMLAELKAEAQEALDNLRDLARGIFPPLLADRGLAPALEAQARKSPVPVTVAADGVGRFPEEVEAGVYFCCLEALQNVAKYSAATRATVSLSLHDGDLRFSVEDDGRGFDPATTAQGAGLQNMADRLGALGGTLEVTSAPGRGTRVVGRLPMGGRT
jgi:signal transduction histidine kinase